MFTIKANIEIQVSENLSKITPATISLNEEELTNLVFAILNAKTGDLFGRAKSLLYKINDLSFQNLF